MVVHMSSGHGIRQPHPGLRHLQHEQPALVARLPLQGARAGEHFLGLFPSEPLDHWG